MHGISIVPFSPERLGVSVPAITKLLHSAYAPLAEQGLRYLASHQTPEVTLRRLTSGESYLALNGERVLGTITLEGPKPASAAAWYRRADVHSFHQFAIDPGLQGRGLGSRLLDTVEAQARARGARELALDTSEKAARLIAVYVARGFRFIEHVQWEEVNYRSVILSKQLVRN